MKRDFIRLIATASAILSSASYGASNSAPLPPPYAGAYQPVGVDEIGRWREADEDEQVLANSPIVIRDEALNAYIRRVLCTAVGDDRCKAARIYIMRIPVFNASMTPNGTMRVSSGMLLRMRNEAELAMILGHEFGHFEQRHTLNIWKAQRSVTDLLSWAQVFAAMGNSYQAYSNFNDLELSVYGRLYRFGRDQEREADALGLRYLNGSTLRPQAGSAVWQNLIDEQEASALAKGVKKPNFNKIAFFASHPPDGERAITMAALADPAGAGRDDGAARYVAAMATWLPVFLDDQIKLNDFGASDHIISALAENGWTAPLLAARGDLYRARGNPRDLVQASEFYGKAVGMDPALPDAQRGFGLSLIKTGRQTEGQAALRRYLELKPNASDASMISMLALAAGGQ